MLKVYAHQYIELGRYLSNASMSLHGAKAGQLSEPEIAGLRVLMQDMARMCDQAGLKVSKGLIDRAVADLPQTDRELEILSAAVLSELSGRLFLHVPEDRASFYERPSSLQNMPTAAREIVRAGNCIAAGEYAAAVFHSMRAVEVALKATYACIGLPSIGPTERSWGVLCNRIKDHLPTRGKAWGELSLFNEIHAMLVVTKDAWRNGTMHVEHSYDQQQAERIYVTSCDFVQKVASRMGENGEPLA
jgi:HEPN domain-containing protein